MRNTLVVILLIGFAATAAFSADIFGIGYIELEGKPVHMFPDEVYNRIYVVNYQTNEVDVVNSLILKKQRSLKESKYPVYVSLSEKYIIVSDFWGYKLDFYLRSSMDFLRSVNVRQGPGYSYVRNDLLYFVTQREYYLQVLDIDNFTVSQEFELSGRVPKFYFYEDIVILPYYDNYHTWSRDFELEESVGFINVSSLFRWNLEGMTKKPLNILEIEQGKYIITGYLDNGIWKFDWGSMNVDEYITWKGHSHIMDMAFFCDDVVIPSMSDEYIYFVNLNSKFTDKVKSARGIIALENYGDEILIALSNFENKVLVYDSGRNLAGEYETGDYPISMCILDNRLYVLSMDDARIDVFKIQ